MLFSATDCKAGLKTSSPLKRRVLQPAPAGLLKQRTAPPHPAPVEATLGWAWTEGFFHRPTLHPKTAEPAAREGVRGDEAAAGRGSHSPAGQRGLGSRQASRGQPPAAGNKCLRALRVEAIPGSPFPGAGPQTDRGQRPGVEDPPSALRPPRLCLCGPSARGSL